MYFLTCKSGLTFCQNRLFTRFPDVVKFWHDWKKLVRIHPHSMFDHDPEFANEILCLEVHNTCFSPSFFQGIKLIVSIRGTFDCVLNGQRLRGVSGVLLNQNIDHSVSAPDASLLIYYIDSNSPLSAMLHHQLANQDWVDITGRINALSVAPPCSACSPEGPNQDASEFATYVLTTLFPGLENREMIQDRALKLIRFVNEHVHQPLSLTDVADLLSLSVERARHVFEEQMAMPFTQYVLWMRLRSVIQKSLQQQQPLSRTALEYGFTDQSHFSRMFKRTFGTQPRHLLTTKGTNRVLLLSNLTTQATA